MFFEFFVIRHHSAFCAMFVSGFHAYELLVLDFKAYDFLFSSFQFIVCYLWWFMSEERVVCGHYLLWPDQQSGQRGCDQGGSVTEVPQGMFGMLLSSSSIDCIDYP